ncbi:unnamed protein product [Mycena citricolor]|uniref:Uncharacterized protein n=1 Tax=Mycena citricolor TaxID=2018698 RepID=A0AAD2K4B7_9AGAR|nr:unnamed protein product [Mycena citricolor]
MTVSTEYSRKPAARQNRAAKHAGGCADRNCTCYTRNPGLAVRRSVPERRLSSAEVETPSGDCTIQVLRRRRQLGYGWLVQDGVRMRSTHARDW